MERKLKNYPRPLNERRINVENPSFEDEKAKQRRDELIRNRFITSR